MDTKWIHIFSRDDTSHASDDHFTQDRVSSVIGIITYLLKNAFVDIPVFPVLGNHDHHTKNQFGTNEDEDIYDVTAELWSQWLQPYGVLDEYKENCEGIQSKNGRYQLQDQMRHLAFIS